MTLCAKKNMNFAYFIPLLAAAAPDESTFARQSELAL